MKLFFLFERQTNALLACFQHRPIHLEDAVLREIILNSLRSIFQLLPLHFH